MCRHLNCPTAALVMFVASSALAQNADNGRRISERSCASCHRIDDAPGKTGRAIAFSAIVTKPSVNAETIASFLLMPHVTMPGLPLSRSDAQDVAAFIMSQKK
jgi:mono/diheme cytochrome c family protein